MRQRILIVFVSMLTAQLVVAQLDLNKPFEECDLKGSTTIYNYKKHKWIFSDEADAQKETLPASTFKIINLLIALETGVIKNENEIVKWIPGNVDTSLYGHRTGIFHDMSVKEAFEVSAGWVFVELAKRVGKTRYQHYLTECKYGNKNYQSEQGIDFWNFGSFGISPRNQVEFLIKVYEEKLPFSKTNIAILKRVMIAEQTPNYTIRSKTGWTKRAGEDIGWWVGYVQRADNVYFFATRLTKDIDKPNPNFDGCRKEITKKILKQLGAID